jgi:hypothetical protein
MSEWVPMKEAATRLKISYAKILRLADRKEIETRDDPLDRRTKLVDLDEVKRIFQIK